MTLKFQASTLIEELVADNDPQYLHVGMADATGTNYLALHRSQPLGDNEDWGVYVEVNDQGFSGYNRISKCELTDDGIVVHFTEPLGRNGQIESVEVHFGNTRQPPGFSSRLRAIFTGYESQLVVKRGSPEA